MCTPWTITRLMRWRVRDWASCFFACRLPLDEEPDTYCSSSVQVSSGTMVLNMKDGSRSYKTNKKLSQDRRCNQERELIVGSTQATDPALAENGTDDSSWPRFQDDDYIVFCFKEDGAFHVVKDGKPETSDHLDCTIRRSRPVSRKLNYGEDAETVYNNSREEMLNEDGDDIDPTTTNERELIISDKEGEEEESIYLDPESNWDGIRGEDQIEDDEECATVSVESSGSNQSVGSTGSFAFPVMRWEWAGSPVQMPRSNGLDLRKHRARRMGLHCCRF